MTVGVDVVVGVGTVGVAVGVGVGVAGAPKAASRALRRNWPQEALAA